MTKPTATEIAAYYQQAAGPMSEVMREMYRLVEALGERGHRVRALREAFGRAMSWVRSLAKLNQMSDIQAFHAANRALLEIAVDSVLLHADKTDESALKLLGYEESGFLKYVNTYKDFIKRRKIEPDPAYAGLLAVSEATLDRIKADRRRLWATDKHPDRWTGRGSLLEDVLEADQRSRCACWSSLGSLEQAYAERYQPLNWLTHGSAATGMRHIPDLDVLNSVALRDSLFLAEVVLKVGTHEFPEVLQERTLLERLDRLKLHLDKDAPVERGGL
jgi:hypothetical protein